MMLAGYAVVMKAILEANYSSIAYFKDNLIDKAEDQYLLALDYMNECLEELEPPVNPNTTITDMTLRTRSSALFLSHLPPIDLPSFDGNVDHWEAFHDRFTSLIIKNKELNDFARMHFLTSTFQGRALAYIKKLSVTADNFEIAFQALIKRFENRR